MKHIRPYQPLVLPGVLLVVFVALAFNFSLLSTIDQAIVQLIRKIPSDARPFLESITILGNFYEDIVLILIIAAWELYRRHYNRAFIASLSLLAFPLFFAVKETVARARPTGADVIAANLPGFSFPSGHAVTSAVAFGLLAIMLFSHLKNPWRNMLFAICLAIIVTVGVSRVYLGAHYPTDVVGGWLLAFTVLGLLRALSIYLASKTSHDIADTTENPEAAK